MVHHFTKSKKPLWLFPKWLFNINAVQNRQKWNGRHLSVWQHLYSLEMLKLFLWVFSEYQGCYTDSLSVSVYGGLVIYILTLAALNVQETCVVFDVSFIEVNQNTGPNFYNNRLHGKWLIHVQFSCYLIHSNNTWMNKFISNLCVLLPLEN